MARDCLETNNCTDRFNLTSGYPLGSKYESGMPQFGGNPSAWCCVRSDGGVGAVTYSVNARLLTLAVMGVVGRSVMVIIIAYSQEVRVNQETSIEGVETGYQNGLVRTTRTVAGSYGGQIP